MSATFVCIPHACHVYTPKMPTQIQYHVYTPEMPTQRDAQRRANISKLLHQDLDPAVAQPSAAVRSSAELQVAGASFGARPASENSSSSRSDDEAAHRPAHAAQRQRPADTRANPPSSSDDDSDDDEDEDGDGRKKRGFFKSRKNKRQRGLDSAAGSTHRGCFAQVGFWIENKILRGRLAVWRWMVQRYHGADMLERITAPSDAIFFAEVVTSMTVRNPKP